MRITSVAAGKAAYYDRNPINKSQSSYNSLVGPHGLTVRVTYTVPAGRKAIVSYASLARQRNTAAAPVGGVDSLIRNLTSSFEYLRDEAAGDNALNPEPFQWTAPLGATLAATEGIQSLTADFSTGGTVTYWSTQTITEFDA